MAWKHLYASEGLIRPEDISVEDGGMARIHNGEMSQTGGGDWCIFTRLQSWDENKRHPFMSMLEGKRVRITVEFDD